MGSQSDWGTMRHAAETLDQLGIPHDDRIVSAHRTPDRMIEFARSAKGRGVEVIIAGAGGAAHLPGMVAALTPLPVFGVPVQSKALSGQDSLLSIVQMPAGVPVGHPKITERQYCGCQEGCVDRASPTDGQGADGDTGWHLHDGEQTVLA